MAGRGFSERNVIVSASHTHCGPSQFANFATLNTLAPSTETITDPRRFVDFLAPRPAEPEIYTFLVKRLAMALRRADRDVGPAAAAWGTKRLLGVTENRSLEAHLADHGVIREFGQGSGRRGSRRATCTRSIRWSACCASIASRGRRPDPDRRLVDVRQPRHRQPARVRGLHAGSPRRRAARLRAADPPRRAGAPPPAGDQRVRQLQRGRPVGRPARPGARRSPSGSAGARRKAMFAAWRKAGQAADEAPEARPALDADLLLRPADQRRPGRRRAGRRACPS